MKSVTLNLSVLMLCLFFSAGTIAAYEPNPILDRCNLAASSPDDADRMERGLSDAEVRPLRAIEACMAAVKHKPNDGRSWYQLSRVQFLNGRPEKAYESLRIAARLGYRIAQAQLAEFEAASDPMAPYKEYELPYFVKWIYEGALEKIPDSIETRHFVYSFVTAYEGQCNKYGGSPFSAQTQNAFYSYTRVIRKEQAKQIPDFLGAFVVSLAEMKQNAQRSQDFWGSTVEGTLNLEEKLKEEGSKLAIGYIEAANDGVQFHAEYSCSGKVASTFSDNLSRLIKYYAQRVPKNSGESLYQYFSTGRKLE